MFKRKRPFPRKPHVFTSKYLYWKTLDILDEVVQANPHLRTALDVPTGGGAIAKYMQEDLGLQVYCSDIDASKYDYEAPFQAADLSHKLPFADESFDLTICMEGLKHVPDIEVAMKELTRVTKPGGYILLTIPNDLSLQTKFRYFFDSFVDCDWNHPISPDDKNVSEYVYGKSLTNLPHLYFYIVANKLKLIRTACCHYRFASLLLMVLFYPFILFATAKATTVRHPLFRQLISPTWLAGKRNLILTKKNSILVLFFNFFHEASFGLSDSFASDFIFFADFL